jgi:hypothetical protein
MDTIAKLKSVFFILKYLVFRYIPYEMHRTLPNS